MARKIPWARAFERRYYRTYTQSYAASVADIIESTLEKQTLVAFDKILGGR